MRLLYKIFAKLKHKDAGMNTFQFQTVPNIIAGLGAIQQLQPILIQQKYRKALLVTDAGMIQHQLHLPILEILQHSKLDYLIYSFFFLIIRRPLRSTLFAFTKQ